MGKSNYKELEKLKTKFEEARKEFTSEAFEYLEACLSDVGYANSIVNYKRENVKGVIRVVSNPYDYQVTKPYVYKFYPLKKSGEVSVNSLSISKLWVSYDLIPEMLSETFELVGDLNEC